MPETKDILIIGAVAGGAVIAMSMLGGAKEDDYPFSGSQFSNLTDRLHQITERIEGGTSEVFKQVTNIKETIMLPSTLGDAFANIQGGIGERLAGIGFPEMPTFGATGTEDRNLLFPLLNPAVYGQEVGQGIVSMFQGLLFPFYKSYEAGGMLATVTKRAGSSLASGFIDIQKGMIDASRLTVEGQTLKNIERKTIETFRIGGVGKQVVVGQTGLTKVLREAYDLGGIKAMARTAKTVERV